MREKDLKKNIYIHIYECMYNWITLLYIWNWHNIVNQLQFSNKKILIIILKTGTLNPDSLFKKKK